MIRNPTADPESEALFLRPNCNVTVDTKKVHRLFLFDPGDADFHHPTKLSDMLKNEFSFGRCPSVDTPFCSGCRENKKEADGICARWPFLKLIAQINSKRNVVDSRVDIQYADLSRKISDS
jgi:hypothetical protein